MGWDKLSTDAVSRVLVGIVLMRSDFMMELKLNWNLSVTSTQFNSTKSLNN